MNYKLHGIEIIRAYELSWLNLNGKPQLGVLEIKQGFGMPEIDTWKLKSFLESINNQMFNEIKSVHKAIYDCVNIDNIRIITQENFSEIKYFELAANYVGADGHIGPDLTLRNVPISFGLRFICQNTSQPYIGTVNIIAPNTSSLNASEIEIANIINSFRNLELVPQTLVNDLFYELCKHFNSDFILSVHLNRRGGISYQALCSTKSINFAPLCHRSVLE